MDKFGRAVFVGIGSNIPPRIEIEDNFGGDGSRFGKELCVTVDNGDDVDALTCVLNRGQAKELVRMLNIWINTGRITEGETKHDPIPGTYFYE